MDFKKMTPEEIALEACGYEEDGTTPKSNVYLCLNKINVSEETESTLDYIDAQSAAIVLKFEPEYICVYICFKSSYEQDLRATERIVKRYIELTEKYSGGNEVPDLSLYILPKKYKSHVIISANLPIDFNLLSESSDSYPNVVLLKYEYDSVSIEENPEADEQKWDSEVLAEMEFDEQREQEIQHKLEEKRNLEKERYERLQKFKKS